MKIFFYFGPLQFLNRIHISYVKTNSKKEFDMGKNISVFKDRWAHPFLRDFDKFFGDMYPALQKQNDRFNFTPTCEVSEDKEGYFFKFDLPGVKKDQINVELHDNILTISAERKEEIKKDEEKSHLSEVYYGSYSRSFTLPKAVNEAQVLAKYEDGVLTVNIPKTDKPERKKISVE